MFDDHETHLAEHLWFLPTPPTQMRVPVRPRWRRYWRQLTFRSTTELVDIRETLNAHIEAHQRMMDEMSGVSDVMRGQADG